MSASALHSLFQRPSLPLTSIEFVSLEFALFFLLFLPLYWTFARFPKIQNMLLLAAGIGWLTLLNPLFAAAALLHAGVVILVTARIDAAQEHAPDDPQAGRGWLIFGIVFAVGHLALFKYFDFLRGLLPAALQDGAAHILLPLGISYYTFQSITYLVAVYRCRIFSWPWYEVPLYLCFFPTLSSGPIWRADGMRALAQEFPGADVQLREERRPVRPAFAVTLALVGVIKVWWLAGALDDGFVRPVFAELEGRDSFSVLMAVYGYTAQLYLNFSGHADLAIGIAMLLGFRLPPNFAAPFLAHNLREFWRRWHISLSTWIRDYIYIPLGGSYCSFTRTQVNVLIAMTLSGMWHGAGWTFLVWGLLHGLGLVLLNAGDEMLGVRDRLADTALGRAFGIFCTFNFVAFAFILFRSANLTEALHVAQAVFLPTQALTLPPTAAILVCVLLLPALFARPLWRALFEGCVRGLERLPVEIWCLPLAALAVFLLIVAPSGVPGFLYANF